MEEKHLNYATFTELIALVNSYLQDRDIADDVNIRLSVPHESFRMIDTGIRNDAGELSEEPAKEVFLVNYDEHLSVAIIDKTELEIKEVQEQNNG